MAFACVFCSGEEHSAHPVRDAKDGKPIVVAACASCGLVQLRDRPSDEELSRFYARDYRREYRGAAQPKLRHVLHAGHEARARLAPLLPLLPSGARLLDIGAGGGEFVYLARRAGLEAEGIDPNGGYLEFARSAYDVPLSLAEVADLDPSRRFHAITLFHVLEHLAHPADVVAQIHGLLEDDGLFAVEVPNFGSPALAPGNVFFKAHISYFTPPMLELLVAGRFAPVEMRAGKVLYAVFRKVPVHKPDTDALRAASRALSAERLRRRGLAEYLRHGGATAVFRTAKARLHAALATRNRTAREILDRL